jgi:hypothetical protein
MFDLYNEIQRNYTLVITEQSELILSLISANMPDKLKYKPDSFYIKIINYNLFQKVIPIFLHILPVPPYTFTIARSASLCRFQKSLALLLQPSLSEIFTSSSALRVFLPRASLSEPNKCKSLGVRSELKAGCGSTSQLLQRSCCHRGCVCVDVRCRGGRQTLLTDRPRHFE